MINLKIIIQVLVCSAFLLIAEAPVSFSKSIKATSVKTLIDRLAALSKIKRVSLDNLKEDQIQYKSVIGKILKDEPRLAGSSTSPYYFIKSIESQLAKKLNKSGEALANRLVKADSKERKTLSHAIYVLSRKAGFKVSDKSVKQIITVLKETKNPDTQKNLLYALGKIGPQIDAVGDTVFDVIDKASSPRARRYAITALGDINRFEAFKDHEKAVKFFLKLLDSDVVSYRQAGAAQLRNCHYDSQIVVPALLKALDDNYLKVRQSAAYALRDHGPEASAAIPVLIKAAKDETGWGIGPYCVHALQSIGRDDPKVISAYIEFLDDPKLVHTTLYHVSLLGKYGKPVAPKVAEFLKKGDVNARRNAARALGKIGTPKEIPELKQALKDSDGQVRNAAKQSIKLLSSNSNSE